MAKKPNNYSAPRKFLIIRLGSVVLRRWSRWLDADENSAAIEQLRGRGRKRRRLEPSQRPPGWSADSPPEALALLRPRDEYWAIEYQRERERARRGSSEWDARRTKTKHEAVFPNPLTPRPHPGLSATTLHTLCANSQILHPRRPNFNPWEETPILSLSLFFVFFVRRFVDDSKITFVFASLSLSFLLFFLYSFAAHPRFSFYFSFSLLPFEPLSPFPQSSSTRSIDSMDSILYVCPLLPPSLLLLSVPLRT